MSYRAWIYLQHLLYFLGISHTLAFTVISERINTKKQSLRGVIVLFCPGSTKNKYCCSEVSQSYPSKGANFPLLPLSNLKKGTKKNMIQNTNTLYRRSETRTRWCVSNKRCDRMARMKDSANSSEAVLPNFKTTSCHFGANRRNPWSQPFSSSSHHHQCQDPIRGSPAPCTASSPS